MRVSVLIPTYRRAADLVRCLHAVEAQRRLPDEVIVVVRSSDEESREALRAWQDRRYLRIVSTSRGGQVNALNAGLDAVTGEIVMITDDDTVPQPSWVERVEQHFARDLALGGVGGRDIVHHGEALDEGPCEVVGKVMWFGRVVGNHHLIAPGSSLVDTLKGANMSYRVSAIGADRFDTRLRGAGAQVGNDMAFSMALRKKGWKLLYDPAVTVDHFPSVRFDSDQRGKLDLQAAENMAFNNWWTLKLHLRPGPRRWAALAWERLIGTTRRPGGVRLLVSRWKSDRPSVELGEAAQRGRSEADREFRMLRKGRSADRTA